MTAEAFLILKEKLKTRGLFECWNQFMAGFSNTIETKCPMCKKFEGWVSDSEKTDYVIEPAINEDGQKNVE